MKSKNDALIAGLRRFAQRIADRIRCDLPRTRRRCRDEYRCDNGKAGHDFAQCPKQRQAGKVARPAMLLGDAVELMRERVHSADNDLDRIVRLPSCRMSPQGFQLPMKRA